MECKAAVNENMLKMSFKRCAWDGGVLDPYEKFGTGGLDAP